MHIAVLNSSYEKSESEFKAIDPYRSPSHIFSALGLLHTTELILIDKANHFAQLRDIVASKKFDLFFNLCDGAFDEDRAGVEVTEVLESFNVPFVGCGSTFYDMTKEEMKRCCLRHSVKTPLFAIVRSEADLDSAADLLKFPAIIKHYNGYNSIGMTRKSKVHNKEEMRAEALRFMSDYGGAMVEEFVEGKEFTVLLAETRSGTPQVLPPFECAFPQGETFKHFELKVPPPPLHRTSPPLWNGI